MRVGDEDRHARAEPAEVLGELAADRPGADDHEAARRAVRPDRLPVRPVLDLVDAVDRRNRGLRAGRDDEVRVLDLAPVHLDRAGAHDACLPADELGSPLLRDPVRVPGVVAPARDEVAPVEDLRDVELAPDRLRRAGRVPRGREHLARPQQRLRGHARVVRALAAGERALGDDDLHLGVEPAQGVDEVLAARARSEYDHRSIGTHRIPLRSRKTG